MINKRGDVTSLNENQLPVLNNIIDEICRSALSGKHSSVLPTAETVAEGEMVIYDDGSGTKRLYVKTAKGNLGYVNLT